MKKTRSKNKVVKLIKLVKLIKVVKLIKIVKPIILKLIKLVKLIKVRIFVWNIVNLECLVLTSNVKFEDKCLISEINGSLKDIEEEIY